MISQLIFAGALTIFTGALPPSAPPWRRGRHPRRISMILLCSKYEQLIAVMYVVLESGSRLEYLFFRTRTRRAYSRTHNNLTWKKVRSFGRFLVFFHLFIGEIIAYFICVLCICFCCIWTHAVTANGYGVWTWSRVGLKCLFFRTRIRTHVIRTRTRTEKTRLHHWSLLWHSVWT